MPKLPLTAPHPLQPHDHDMVRSADRTRPARRDVSAMRRSVMLRDFRTDTLAQTLHDLAAAPWHACVMTLRATTIASGDAPAPAALEAFRAFDVELRLVADRSDAAPLRHVEAWRLIDDYLGEVIAPRGRGRPVRVRLGGLSGTALKVAVRHADVFEMPATVVAHLRAAIERVRDAAAEHGRAPLPIALPVRIGSGAALPKPDALTGSYDILDLAGDPERLALTLQGHCEAGVEEFVVFGSDAATTAAIQALGRLGNREGAGSSAMPRILAATASAVSESPLDHGLGGSADEEGALMPLSQVDVVQLRAWAEAGIIPVALYRDEMEARRRRAIG